MTVFKATRNGAALPLASLPQASFDELRRAVIARVEGGQRLASFFGEAAPDGGVVVTAVLADDPEGRVHVARARLEADTYPALTPECPQAHWFEREVAEQYGVRPEGHPFLKPIRFHASYRPGHDAWGRDESKPPVVGVTDFYRVEGDEIHEVAVGPVHAGVIEPGHFRFQCHGEHVYHLEISLGYQHRGIERALLGGPRKITVHQIETLAGDTTVGHAAAYCQALEALSKTAVPPRAQALRGVALELERLANHVGDLGALAGDVGYLPTSSFCGRIRGDFLNMTAVIVGNRFGRGLVRPGGVTADVDDARAKDLLERLARAERDVTVAVELLWETPSVQTRFESAGFVTREDCEKVGLVGVAARACGVERDVRRDHPTGIYQYAHIPIMTGQRGEVFSRAYVRWLEIQQSIAFVRARLSSLPKSDTKKEMKPVAPDSLAVSLVEGWRGEICHVVVTDPGGRFARYKVTDPSFHNWFGVALALRGEEISDFPLCNKSFNLSYCGHDL